MFSIDQHTMVEFSRIVGIGMLVVMIIVVTYSLLFLIDQSSYILLFMLIMYTLYASHL